MSKKLLVMIAVIMAIICVLSFTACKQEEEPQDVKFTVTFDLNYEGAPEPFLVTVNENAVVPTQTAPVRNGYNFGGWYTDKTCTTEFTFDAVGSTAVIVKDITLYAKWTAKDIIDSTPILSTIVAFYNGENIFVGEDLDVADIVVTATYTDTSKKTVTDFTISGFDSETAGVKTVKVTYTEKGATRTATVDVTVVEKVVLASISAVYGGGDILVGGTLDKATIVVIATYSDETTKAITDFSISGFDSETVGAKTVTVSYTEGEITKTDDVVITVKECEHTGGKATCKTLAVCTECGESYGELDEDNHEGDAEWTITETTHAQSYTCCSLVVVAEGNHEGGTATCKTLAVCTVCEESYGELDADNHEGTAEWTITETTHAQSYTCCSLVVVAEGNHEGGTATCKALAECTVCEERYGELDADNHEGTAEWTITETTHAQSYICCHAVVVAEGNHEYDNACDADCNECGYVREVGDHAYDNACDTDCNYCGEVREVGNHVYDNACDTTCNECGDVREVEDHVYSNTCDVDCNVCGEIREITHTYTGDCDEICNVCGEVRETETEHTYVEAVCTVCGQVSPDIPSLSSITAAYDQGEKIIFVGDSVDTIKEDIVVTAHYTLGKADAVVEDWTAVIDGTKAGDSTVTITYTEGGIVKTTTVAIVLTRKLALISVEEYEEFVKYNSELQITVHAMFYGMDEDYVEDVTSKVVISGYNKTFIENTQTVTVSYTENEITETDTIEIAVLNENNGIYAIYEGTLDHNASIEDIIVEDTILAEYVLDNGDHGAAIDSADVTVIAVNASTVGNNGSITITVDGFTYKITGITVVRVFAGYKVSYVGGIVETNADVDLANVKVVANYSDESTEDVEEGITLGEYDNTTTGIKEIEVLVNEEVVGTIKVEYGAYNTIYYYNENGWASVYAHSWGVTETPVTPKAGDYVIVGSFNGWGYNGCAALFNKKGTGDSTEYYFEGLALEKNAEIKLVKVGTDGASIDWMDSANRWLDSSVATGGSGTANVKITNTGVYDVYYTPATGKLYVGATNSGAKEPNVKLTTVFDGTTWPGVQMTAVEGQDGWYSIKVDARANRIIFNNGLSGASEKKTVDLTIDLAKPYYNNGVWESHIHTYSADCDTTCNYEGCEVTRTTSESHSYPNDCTATICTVCNEVTKVADEHTGGEATCKTLAVCTECGKSYGELDLDNHEGDAEWIITETTHTQKYTCCEAVKVAEGNHEGGTATCIAKAVCIVCETAYGGFADHTYDANVWESDDNQHWHVCTVDGCEVTDTKAAHEYVEGTCVCGKEAPIIITTVGIQATLKNDRVYFVDTEDNDTVDAISASDLVISEVLSDESTELIPQSAYENVTITILSGDEDVAGVCTYVVGYEGFTYNVEVTLVRKLKAVSDDNVFEYDGNVAYGSTTINIHKVLVTYYGVEGKFDVTNQVVVGDFNPTYVTGEQLVDVTYTENGIIAPWEISIIVIDNKKLTVTQKENVDALVLNHEQTSVDVSEILAIYDVKFVYDSGKEDVVTTGITITVSAVECGNTGSITITVDGQSVTIEGLTVVRVLKEITVNYTGDVEIDLNKEINTDDITVTAIYSNNDKEAITDYELSEYDYTTVGTKTISVLVDGDKVGEFTVNYVSYTTYYFNNVDGWEEVYAHSWGVTETPIEPKAGDYVIVGSFNGWESSIANGSAVVLCYSKEDGDGNTEYYFEGLALSANAELRIAKVGSNGTTAEWAEVNLDSTLATGGGSSNVKISGAGNYVFYYTPATGKLYVGATDSGAKEPNVKLTKVFDGTTWHGVQMTAVEGQDGWYAIKVDARANRIVFNNGLSGASEKKTVDLTLDASKPYYNDGVWEDHIHTYSADCDTTCNYEGCEVTRTASESHSYPNNCTATTCTACNEVTRVAGEHTGGIATCIAEAKCTVCGLSYGEKDVNNHAGTAEWTYTDTTHTQTYSCCDKVVVDGEEHEYVGGTCECGKVEPTCEHTGGEATCMSKAVCDLCGEEYGEVNADAHSWNEGEVTTPATCSATGIKTYICTHNAEHTKTEDVAIDENAHAWNAGEVTTPATCSATGTMTYTCTHKAEHTKTEEIAINADAHAWNDGEVTTPATCSATGTKTYICMHNAEHIKTEDVAIDKNAHTQDATWAKDADSHRHYYPCCNADIVGDTAHTWENGVCSVVGCEYICEHTGGEATCTSKKECIVCGQSYGELAAHTYDANVWESDENEHWHVCTVCEAEVTNTKAAHVYEDGECECGATESTEPEDPVEPTTVTKKIADIADAEGWEDGKQYSDFDLDNVITVTSEGGGNTGKYYQSGEDYRIYQSENGTITIAAKEGYAIVSVKITYTVSNTGVLTLNSTNVASGTVVNVNASSITFGVGNTGTKTNGQVRVTAIEVVYQAEGGSEEPEVCEHVYDNDCDAECNNCGATRTPADHVYDNACDADCNECGATRTPADHNYVDGACSVCGKEESTEPEDPVEPEEVTITFEFGENGDAAHVDGSSDKATYSETNGDYTLSITGGSKVYPSSYDAMGNSALKLGSGSAAGKFTFTVPNDITKVIINVAGYKGNTAKVQINSGDAITVSELSNNGEYKAIEVDTTTNKTVSFTTVSGGYRCMINSIVFVKAGSGEVCEHVYDNDCQDTTCNECGEVTREAVDHVYDNDCSDTTCANCAVTREAQEHVYDNDCQDTTCANCAVTREAVDHVYDDDCQDTTCANCAVTREAKAHEYEDCDDTTCANCAVTREAVAHNYVDGECTACGKAEPEVHEHVYDNNCDTTCNTCGETREVGDHVSSGACDTACNVCGATLEATADHTVDNVCADTDCNICGATVVPTGEHSYDNACDTTCNNCGDVREVGDHVYTNACDTTCNNCGDVREVEDHVYDNTCDVDCNECGAEREVAGHVYEDCDDITCNVCNATREPVEHNYVDGICDVCGKEEPVEITLASIEAKVKEGVIFVGTEITASKFDIVKVMSDANKEDLPEAEYANVTVALKNSEDDTDVVGTYVYVVTYQEKSVEVEVTFTRKLKEIQVAYEENVPYGGEIEMLAYATFYGEEGQVDVTESVVISGYNKTLIETQEVTISYAENGITATYVIYVEVINEIKGIQVTLKDGQEAPVLNHNQTTIAVEEITSRYDIVYVYDNGATEELGAEDEITVTVAKSNECGEEGGIDVTVIDADTIEEYSIDISGLTVVAVLESITVNYTGPAEIDVGAELTGLEVVANYSDGAKVTLSADDYEITDFDNTVEDEYLPIVTYQGKEGMFEVTVNDVVDIYFYNYANWTTVSAYAWYNNGTTDVTNAGWPGVVMKRDGTSKWWFTTVDADVKYTSIIFNNGNNGDQTGNLTLDLSKPYFALGAWYASKPTSSEITNNTVIVKDNAGWSSDSAIISVHAWSSSTSNTYQTTKIANNIYAVKIGITFTGMLVARISPTDNSWWNQTKDITDITKRLVTITGWNNDSFTQAVITVA